MSLKKKLKMINEMRRFCAEEMADKVELVEEKERYNEVMQTIEKISQFFSNANPKVTIDLQKDPLTGTDICVEIKAPLIVMYENLKEFCDIVRNADTMEIYPKINEQICIGLTFGGCFRWRRKTQSEPFDEFAVEEDLTELGIFFGGILDKQNEKIYNKDKKK